MNRLFGNIKRALFCLVLAGYGPVFAQGIPPQKVNFQARLTDLSDNPLNGSYTLTFSLYDAPEAGTALWTETQADVSIVNGAVEAVLGSVTPIPWSAAALPGAYLQFEVDSEVMSPRQPFNSVLFAMNAGQLGGKTYDAFIDTFTAQNIRGVKIFATNPVFNDDSIAQSKIIGLIAALAAKADAAAVAADTTTLKSQINAITGDNLGSHTATTTLNMAGYPVINVSTLIVTNAVSAGYFVGNGSGLTGIAGDNLGNHTAISDLNMANFPINNVSTLNVTNSVSAAKYYGDGSHLTGIIGDDLGSHTASNQLNMAGYGIANVSSVTVFGGVAAEYFTGNGAGLTGIAGDNLGSHTATMALNMGGFPISNAVSLTVSSNITANRYYGDGSSLTGIAGDDLGSHTASADLNMSGRNIVSVGTVTAVNFVGNGSQLTGIAGDNLGGHTAAANLDMAQFPVLNVSSIAMVGDGIRIATSVYYGANGIFVSNIGAIMTTGVGYGAVLPDARGTRAVDLQTDRGAAAQVASGDGATLSGGSANTASGPFATVSGGAANTASEDGSTVSGGSGNTASGVIATVSGGQNNTASGYSSTVSGGQGNAAGNNYATVSGGYQNAAGYYSATVSGGYQNAAKNNYATVSGGVTNTASGLRATIPGGESNTASGNYSWAAGFKSSSTANGAFTWSDSEGVEINNNVADRTWFKNRGGFLVSTAAAAGSAIFAVTGTGVGIGTISPDSGLTILDGDIHFTSSTYDHGIRFADGSYQTTAASAGGQSGWVTIEGVMYNTNGGNVGIGTMYPAAKLEIAGTRNSWAGAAFRLTSTDAGAQSYGAYIHEDDSFKFGDLTRERDNITISTMGNISLAPTTGNVGIGNPSPAARLDVTALFGTASEVKAQVWRDYTGTIVASLNAAGELTANKFIGDGSSLTGVNAAGDNLGDHTATADLNMSGRQMLNVSTLTFTSGGISIGDGVFNNSEGGIGIGDGAYSNGNFGLGLGYGASNNTAFGVGIGYYASANDNSGVGIGANAGGNRDFAVGVGANSANNGTYGTALGAYSFAGSYSAALGSYAKANAGQSVAIGNGTVNNSTGTASFGTYAVYTSSFVTAARYYGDGSALTGIASDNLGDHVATTSLNMANYSIFNVGSMMSGPVNATRFEVGGSTVLAVLPGSGSLGVGVGAGAINSGIYNTFLGYQAGYYNGAAGYNTFLGYQAGYANTTGAQNTFVGNMAGNGNTSGANNAVLGHFAGIYSQTGGANTIFGSEAGKGVIVNSFSSSTLVGYRAGTALTTGHGNILLGYQAGDSLTTGYENILIGYDADAPTEDASNFMNLGNSIYAYTLTGRVGIGTAAPITRLHVDLNNSELTDSELNAVVIANTGNYTGNRAGIHFAYNTAGAWGSMIDTVFDNRTQGFEDAHIEIHTRSNGIGYERVRITKDGYIGLGTTVPGAKLDVTTAGSGQTDMAQIWRNSGGAIVSSVSATGVITASKFVGNGSGLTGITGDDLGDHTAAQNLVMSNFGVTSVSSVTASGTLYLAAGGVQGLTLLAGNTPTPGQTGGPLTIASGGGYNAPAGALTISGGNHSSWAPLNSHTDVTINGSPVDSFSNAQLVVGGGKIGTVTGPPQTHGGDITLTGGAGYNGNYNGGNILLMPGAAAGSGVVGRVGIGTTNPAVALDVNGYVRLTTHFVYNSANGVINWGGAGSGDLYFRYLSTQGDQFSNFSERMRIKNTGDIGISTGAPQARLDVLAGGSAQTDMAQIWRNSGGTIVSSVSATGVMNAAKFVGNEAVISGPVTIYDAPLNVRYATLNAAVGIHAMTSSKYSSLELGNLPYIWAISNNESSDNALQLSWYNGSTAWTKKVAFASNGNVGISTMTPQARLDVLAGGSAQADMAQIWRNSGGTIVSSVSATGVMTASKGVVTGSEFSVGGTTLAIKNGFVGIGTDYPEQYLHVQKPVSLVGLLIKTTDPSKFAALELSNGSYAWSFTNNGKADNALDLEWFNGTNKWNRYVTVTSTGNVGISTGNPVARLDIVSAGSAQTDMAQIWRNSGGTIVSSVSATGVLTASKFVGDGSGLTGISVPGSTYTFVIGASYGGGKIYWLDASGHHGLVAAASDQSSASTWSGSDARTGATLDATYAGDVNTVMISTTMGAVTSAANICLDYTATVNNEYYDDWYLPTNYEITLLCAQKTPVGGFSDAYYWSSTETQVTSAWGMYFGSCAPSDNSKASNSRVRCIRSF